MNPDKVNIDFLIGDDSFHQYALQSDEQAIEKWDSFLKSYPEKRAEIEEAISLINALRIRKASGAERAFREDYQKIKSFTEQRTTTKSLRTYWKVAASLLLIASLGWALSRFSLYDYVAENWFGDVLETIECPAGKRLDISLADGTLVKLNGGTSLQYHKDFNKTDRRIVLSGEAFFEVAHKANKPFIIETGSASIKVLGTSFGVKAYEQDSLVVVAVKTGRVLLSDQNDSIQLVKDEKGTLNKELNQLSKSSYDYNETLLWSEDILYFNEATFEEVTLKLEAWYGVTIINNRAEPIPGGFNGRYKNFTLSGVLAGMSFSSKFDYEISGDTVYIE